jgi:DNA invertase Pin-like site-specific DNA recombinase
MVGGAEMQIGYARVSTHDQDLSLQEDGIGKTTFYRYIKIGVA